MRIGIDARLVFYSKAGIGQYIIHLTRGLPKMTNSIYCKAAKTTLKLSKTTILPAPLCGHPATTGWNNLRYG